MSLLYQKHASRPLTLDNRVEPELYRDVFPYTHVSRIEFDDTFLVPRPADPMFITDTTFRDGQQARPPYTVKQIARIYDLLHKLGGKSGLIQASEFFMYSPKDRKAIEVCRSRGYRFPRVTGWIRANMDDLKIAHDMEFDEVGLLTSMSDYHIFLKLGKTREQAMNDYLKVVTKALEWGIVPRCHFEDVTRADIYGFCLPFARKLMELSHEASMPIKIRLCDTMGYGVPFPGAALPRSVQRIVRAFTDEAGVPGAWLEWHGHNDFHKVLVNGVTAWLYGCGGVNGTLMGFGERTGNAPLEALGIELDEASMRKVTERVVELSDKKELVTAEDLPYIIADVLRYDQVENPVRILNYSLSLAQGLHPAATLKIEINGCEYEQTSVGDGQYDAFMRALRQIYKHQLGREFPMLRNYTVSIPPGGRTDAFVQTIITWETGGKEFKTRGLDADQTEAAIKATIKMLNIIEPTYNDHGC